MKRLGSLVYGFGETYEFEDRLLAHLKVVIGSKLRRREGFYLSWPLDPDQELGRTSLWLSPAIPLQFHFSADESPTLNKHWLESMMSSSYGPLGLTITEEPEDTSRAGRPA
ncbi:hypothetical protein [Mycetocola zhujimingii]|uniref:DUF7882 domain-containing protein n=1 Tax=Mycetocola zhujimingii TaxID=2079792 RepID=A0A2U1TF66_9MICO|nr:hypothetical protein [Mycetocola zhujimingii]AWB85726.1 hypothetical protein C3E77_03245 [Mycetocola zhujimingii]PWC07531.1 hypothetical protein DF223_05650 [Mycetocola zhujimingii]